MDELHGLRGVYGGRRVLLTGHTGFKGSWLALWLRQLGAQVMGMALEAPSVPSMHQALRLDELIEGVHLDLRDYARLAAHVAEFSPEIIFHLGAQSLVRPSYADPLGTLQTNVMGTAHVLDACRRVSSVRAIVIVTSDKCYQNNEWVWGYRESDPMGGHDPYSASKGCAELIAASYAKSFFRKEEYGKTHQVAVASARAGNAIGGGDWGQDRLLPDCFRALCAGRSIRIRYPASIRPWQHALECLGGYLLLGSRLLEHGPEYGGAWNFGPMDLGDAWTVERLVEQLCALWGGGRYEVDTGVRPHEAGILRLDCSKASSGLGWRPRYGVAEALAATVSWYRAWAENPEPRRMRDFTMRQIQDYLDKRPV